MLGSRGGNLTSAGQSDHVGKDSGDCIHMLATPRLIKYVGNVISKIDKDETQL